MIKYIKISDMTDEEKAAHPEAETTEGYLKVSDDSKYADFWWNKLSEHQKKVIKAIPNFDADIFKEITGTDVYSKNKIH